MSTPLAIATVVAILLAACAAAYLYFNRMNPYVWEIVVGSVAISLVLGGVSVLIQQIWEKGVTPTSLVLALVVLALLLVLIAALVWLSNTPRAIRKEIPVTYLLSPRKKELPFGLRFAESSPFFFYIDACGIFKNFRDSSPENTKKIEAAAKPPGQGDFVSATEVFQNLTEYLVAYYMATTLTTGEMSLAMYRKEGWRWLGFPHESIAGERKPLEYIAGPLKSNIFYGIRGYGPDHELELRLPRSTRVFLERENGLTSRFTIKNKFMEIKIGIFFDIGGSQSFGFLDESAFLSYGSDVNELKLAFNRYETIVYYDVTFSKWRYAYPEMKHHEEWANDLFAMLQRKFAWGSPALADEVEVFRRFQQATENGKQ